MSLLSRTILFYNKLLTCICSLKFIVILKAKLRDYFSSYNCKFLIFIFYFFYNHLVSFTLFYSRSLIDNSTFIAEKATLYEELHAFTSSLRILTASFILTASHVPNNVIFCISKNSDISWFLSNVFIIAIVISIIIIIIIINIVIIINAIINCY